MLQEYLDKENHEEPAVAQKGTLAFQHTISEREGWRKAVASKGWLFQP